MNHFFSQIWQGIWPISPIEVLFTIFALFVWSRVILRFRAKQINQKELVFWSLLWLTMIIIVYIPGKTTVLAKALGMDRGFDAMIFIAIVALFYIVYRLYVKFNEMEIEVTRLVRQIALHLGVTKPPKNKKFKR